MLFSRIQLMSLTIVENFISRFPAKKMFFLFICLSYLFITIGINENRHKAFDIAAAMAIFCLISEKADFKKIIKESYWFIILLIYILFNPSYLLNNGSFGLGDATFVLRALGSFCLGLCAQLYMPKLWKFCVLLLPVSVAILFVKALIFGYGPSDAIGNRLCLNMTPAPNLLAFVTVSGIIYLICLRYNVIEAIKQKFYAHLFFLTLYGLLFSVLLLTQARTSLLGLFGCFVYWLVCYKRKILSVFAITLLIMCVGYVSMPNNFERFKDFTITNITKNTNQLSSSRFTLWEIYLKMAQDNLVFGVTDSKKALSDFISDKEKMKQLTYKIYIDNNFTNNTPHNIFIAMLFYYGLIGLLLFLAMAFQSIRAAVLSDNKLFISIFIFFGLTGLTDYFFGVIHGVVIYFFTFGVMIADKSQG